MCSGNVVEDLSRTKANLTPDSHPTTGLMGLSALCRVSVRSQVRFVTASGFENSKLRPYRCFYRFPLSPIDVPQTLHLIYYTYTSPEDCKVHHLRSENLTIRQKSLHTLSDPSTVIRNSLFSISYSTN